MNQDLATQNQASATRMDSDKISQDNPSQSDDGCSKSHDQCERVDILIKDLLKLLSSTSAMSNQDWFSFPRFFDSQSRPFVVQPSLFPFVPPTIYFAKEDDPLSEIPAELKRFLKWKLSTITPNTIRSVVTKSGYQLIKDKKNKMKWTAIWCKHMKCSDFRNVTHYQKVNHFPGSFHLGRKDKLWINLKNMANKHGYDVFGEFHPQTFILPHDIKMLKKYWKSFDEEIYFILKPPASARGQGISVINKYSQIPKTAKVKRQKQSNKSSLIVQQYISNPCLLFNGTKFDLRVYVLLTSVVPLRIYVFKDGLVRFASVKYTNDSEYLTDQFMHLTNYSVNKNSSNYVLSNDSNAQAGNKWTLKTLWKFIRQTRSDVDVDAIWNSIKDMIIKTILSCENHIFKLIKQNLKSRYTSFELLGFDIMLDYQFKPWLLEVNISPSLRADTSLDNSVKSQLVTDMLNIVGYRLPPNAYKLSPDAYELCFNKQLFTTTLNEEEKLKHRHFENLFLTQESDERINDDILSNLTGDDIRILIESEDELSRCGSFIRIFPTNKSYEYFQFLDYVFYYNLLLNSWEQQFHDDRVKGIMLIRSLCNYKQYQIKDKDELYNLITENGMDVESDKQRLMQLSKEKQLMKCERTEIIPR